MSSLSKDEVAAVIRAVIKFSEDAGSVEDMELWKPKLVLILHKVLEEFIFVSDENLVLFTECRNDMQKYWEKLSERDRKQETDDYKVVQLRLDNVISKMQLYLLLQKLKAWCV